MNDCTFIILGATGDLAKRKLMPALAKLIKDEKVKNYAIIGAANSDISDEEFQGRFNNAISDVDKALFPIIKPRIFYQRIGFDDLESFNLLASKIGTIEKQFALSGNRIVYVAAPSLYYCPITECLAKSKIVQRGHSGDTPSQRIVYEKPFGVDQQSARDINHCIATWFDESQIYRVDHYLTKELVSNIVLVRFTNIIFEPLWNSNYIDYVEIILSETLGLEGRGRYYDSYGVLRDVVQNHAMQLLSLIAMELPAKLSAEGIQDQKTEVLKNVRVDQGFLGQYDDYHNEPDIAPNSQTPTFSCLKMSVETPRWKGVPFYIKAGKRLDRKDTSIHIKFKNVDCTLKESCVYESDYLTIQIEPNATFSLQLNTKLPGTLYGVAPVQLTFNHDYVFRTSTPESYEILLEQIMAGEQSVSVRFDEIEYAWAVIDSIKNMKLPLYKYKQLSSGPDELKDFAKKNKMRWRV
ncbi:MAG TPA: glucose-6-phosphate dehydrogenase [Candidatus Babeliales bacterium]|nr:glucose-6-phosphate dehydrogenase [Candidatus Babeliales bacterium]